MVPLERLPYKALLLPLKAVFILPNSADTDEITHSAAFHLSLQFAKVAV